MAVGARIEVRGTRPGDLPAVFALSHRVYPHGGSWGMYQLESHLRVFPAGQLVAVDERTNEIVGAAASLVVDWDDYDSLADWRTFTAGGTFTNHNTTTGRTLYGAEVMVDPEWQGRGVGKDIYAARRRLVEDLALRRIRAGARLVGYGDFAPKLTAEDYVVKVVRNEIGDATLSFQLRQGFDVLRVVKDYLPFDRESHGWAALIEWVNPALIKPGDLAGRDPRYKRPLPSRFIPPGGR